MLQKLLVPHNKVVLLKQFDIIHSLKLISFLGFLRVIPNNLTHRFWKYAHFSCIGTQLSTSETFGKAWHIQTFAVLINIDHHSQMF